MPSWLQNPDPTIIKVLLNLFISFLSGFLIGATEIISTFQYRRKLFRMPSAVVFLSFYGLLGVLAFILLTYQDLSYWDNTLAAFAAGISPHVILRSRFSIIRSRDDKGEKKLDLSLDLEQVFNTWVKFFKNRIDVVYMQDQRKLIDRLVKKYTTTQAMRREVSKLLYSRQAMEPSDRDKKLAEAEKIFQEAEDLNDEVCLHRLANLIVRISDFDTLDAVLSQESEARGRERGKQDSVAALLENHPDFMDQMDRWKPLLTEREQQYLDQITQSATLTDKGKAEAVAKYLTSRKKLNDVISKLES
jgi:hypothetical protein